MPVTEEGAWNGPLPDSITVKDAARVRRPWYGRGVAPFLLTILTGSRSGLEWNEGRNVRPAEVFRAIPLVGLLTVPYWCYESLSENTMQNVANRVGMDNTRQENFEAGFGRRMEDIAEKENLDEAWLPNKS